MCAHQPLRYQILHSLSHCHYTSPKCWEREWRGEECSAVDWMPRRPHRGWDKLPTLPFPPPTVSISLCTYIRCGCSHCTGPIKLQLYSSDGSAQCRVELWVGSVENAGQWIKIWSSAVFGFLQLFPGLQHCLAGHFSPSRGRWTELYSGCSYGSFSWGRGKWPQCVIFWQNLSFTVIKRFDFFQVFSTVLKSLCPLLTKNTLVLVLANLFDF